MATEIKDQEVFRDKIATVDEKGKRIWIYPKKPKGKYYNARTVVSIILLLFLFGMPFVKLNGEPLLLFNILERKFILFGLTFLPQDFHLFGLAMITFIIFIALFTAVFGRLFCGWVCPQTIFMEMVFRKIEYFIEGDANQQRRLNKAPWTLDKYFKKISKHAIFFGIAVLVANCFLAWIIGVDEVFKIISEPVSAHFSGFIAMLVFSGMFYFVFARFREQVCVTVCPYGRMQGVLLDEDSIVVHYDFIRGEPRGKIRKKKQQSTPLSLSTDSGVAIETTENGQQLGDCIDCKLCVKVCPTGIDIRNGTQLECVNCTACIDACDEVMTKVKRPTGLIRYASFNSISKKKKFKFTTRAIAYSIVLVLLIVLQSFLLAGRADLEVTILRTPGMLYHKVVDDHISNLYNYRVANKTNEDVEFELKLLEEDLGTLRLMGDQHTVPAQGSSEGVFFIDIPNENYIKMKKKIVIDVIVGDERIDRVKASFLGPLK